MAEIVDQPPPVARPGVVSVQSMVRADLEERERIGIERYGMPLQAHNGRNPLVDAYQEALDLSCYLRQAIDEERGDLAAELRGQVADLERDLRRERDLTAELRRQLAARDRTIDRMRSEGRR